MVRYGVQRINELLYQFKSLNRSKERCTNGSFIEQSKIFFSDGFEKFSHRNVYEQVKRLRRKII